MFCAFSQSQSITISKSKKSHIPFSLLYEIFGGITTVEIEDGIRPYSIQEFLPHVLDFQFARTSYGLQCINVENGLFLNN
jgi:hypothetical protein